MTFGTTRLINQRLINSDLRDPKAVATHLCGLQGQDLESAKWSIGLRVPGSTLTDVEQAFTEGALVRTWPMRGTLHVVAAEDLRWLVALTSKQNLARVASRLRSLELDEKTLAASRKVLIRELRGGTHLAREQLFAALEGKKISTEGQRGYHLLWHAAVMGLLCYAEGKTFTLVDEWLPTTKEKSRDEAVAELALRYFTSRGPATLKDFTWWSGLTVREARAGLAASSGRLAQLKADGETWWLPVGSASGKSTAFALPGFDEFILGYQSRSVVLEPKFKERICPGGNGVFAPTLVLEGQVVGTWKRADGALSPFTEWNASQRRLLLAAVERANVFQSGRP